MKNILLIIFAALILASCNNAARDQALQQAAADAAVQREQLKQQQKADLTKRIREIQIQINNCEQNTVQAQASLTTANDELTRAQEFHLLRSSSERSADIQNASLKVNELNLTIQKLSGAHQQLLQQQATLNSQFASI